MAKAAQTDPATLLKLQSNISVQRHFEVSLLLTLAIAFVTVAMTGKLDFVSTVVISIALGVKLWSYSREAAFSLSPRTVTRVSIFYIFFYALDFLIFSPGPGLLDKMLTATVHLVLFTTIIKIFSARTYRDYGYLATLSFVMMLASAILTVSTTFLIFFGSTLFWLSRPSSATKSSEGWSRLAALPKALSGNLARTGQRSNGR